ncbi:MAG: Tim44/TimA family putative adaptor protein, partial [Parvularcula sp.]|nr:Tim44/TimA family putative adaptor protein [Parvularcula sp.]
MDLTLIIFAALALFLSYRLFNVLGTKGGHEPDEHDRPILKPAGGRDEAFDAEAAGAETVDTRKPQPSWASPIVEHYPGFDADNFLEGAAQAYEMIVQAYVDGDLDNVRAYVDADVLKSFEVAIDGREHAGQESTVVFVGVKRPEVLGVETDEHHLRAELRFTSEQVRFVKDKDGGVIEGSETQVIDVEDRWVFERDIRSRDPNWTLVATQ